jgi:hypothetical protein
MVARFPTGSGGRRPSAGTTFRPASSVHTPAFPTPIILPQQLPHETRLAAAEEAGIDSAALLLFAADFDGCYWDAARAVVERVSARTTNKPFLPTDRQKRILDILDGKTKKLAQLADTLKVRPSTLSGRDLKELRDQELVRHDKRIGYYRPDAPPPELSGTLR